MKILAFAAAMRKESYNKMLILQACEAMRQIQDSRHKVEVDLCDFRDFDMPMYDGDWEDANGMPVGAKRLVQKILDCQGMIISTPEYNGGIPGTLKNAIDWASRPQKNPFIRKPLLLLGATPGSLAATRGLWHTRVPFEALGCFVYSEMFGLAKADEAFDGSGKLIDPKNAQRLSQIVQGFIGFAAQLNGL